MCSQRAMNDNLGTNMLLCLYKNYRRGLQFQPFKQNSNDYYIVICSISSNPSYYIKFKRTFIINLLIYYCNNKHLIVIS